MSDGDLVFNPPPGWPKPPSGWRPPKGWEPDPAWPSPPPGWQLWVPENGSSGTAGSKSNSVLDAQASHSHQQEMSETGDSGSLTVDVRVARLEAENAALRQQIKTISSADEVVILDDEYILQEVGIYRYHHPLENADAYKAKLKDVSTRIADLVKSKQAIEMSNMFTFDNSLAKGRKMSSDLGKLMLRAYNAEVDNSIRSLRAGNVVTAKKRIEASRAAIKRLGQMMQMQISDEFHAVRLEEVELTADYLMKKQEERELAREERARLREERKVEQELAAERERLDKERSHLMNAVEALRDTGDEDAELERKLAELDEAIAQNDYRAANIRAGYVYIISNRGAFGPNVVKIGLTRRLEPIDRVNELSGAAVPFRFDVHALFFSEDAVTLETELHHHFAERKVNHSNTRKEFFFASPAEVRQVLMSKVGNLLDYVEDAESTEFLQSIRYWPEEFRQRN